MNTTKIQGHRGANNERPENTLASFKRAIELGADGIELDVYRLKDGSLIVHHDDVLGRCFEGTGSFYNISGEELRKHKLVGKYAEDYKNEKIPYLYEVLDLLKGTNVLLNVEIKYESHLSNETADEIVSLIKKYNMEDRCIISSFNHQILTYIKKKYPEIKVGAIYGENYSFNPAQYAKEMHFDAVHPPFQTVTKQVVDECHKNNVLVNVYTVDSSDDIREMINYGVDSIITNNIAFAKNIISGK